MEKNSKNKNIILSETHPSALIDGDEAFPGGWRFPLNNEMVYQLMRRSAGNSNKEAYENVLDTMRLDRGFVIENGKGMPSSIHDPSFRSFVLRWIFLKIAAGCDFFEPTGETRGVYFRRLKAPDLPISHNNFITRASNEDADSTLGAELFKRGNFMSRLRSAAEEWCERHQKDKIEGYKGTLFALLKDKCQRDLLCGNFSFGKYFDDPHNKYIFPKRTKEETSIVLRASSERDGYIKICLPEWEDYINAPNEKEAVYFISRDISACSSADYENFSYFLAPIFKNQEIFETLGIQIGALLHNGANRRLRLPYLIGAGKDGKSTLLQIIKETLGECCDDAIKDILDPASYPMRLGAYTLNKNGTRLALFDEIDFSSKTFDVTAFKVLGSGDSHLMSRLHGRGNVKVPVTFGSVIAGNGFPTLSVFDEYAVMDRVALYEVQRPSDEKIEEFLDAKDDPEMMESIRRGCLLWIFKGLQRDFKEEPLDFPKGTIFDKVPERYKKGGVSNGSFNARENEMALALQKVVYSHTGKPISLNEIISRAGHDPFDDIPKERQKAVVLADGRFEERKQGGRSRILIKKAPESVNDLPEKEEQEEQGQAEEIKAPQAPCQNEKVSEEYVSMPAMDQVADSLATALENAGAIVTRPPVLDGSWHGYDLKGKAKGNEKLRYIAHYDEHPAGKIMNMITGEEISWSFKGGATHIMSAAEKKRIDDEREKNDLKKAQDEKEAVKSLKIEINKLTQKRSEGRMDFAHPYLERKKILNQSLFPYYFVDGESIIALAYNVLGEIQTAQYILKNGEKRLKKDISKKGGFFKFGSIKHSKKIIICEGFATGATIFQQNKDPDVAVICAIDAGNLLPVVEAMVTKFKDKKVSIYADDDRFTEIQGKPFNTGIEKALAAAVSEDIEVFAPDWPEQLKEDRGCTDFNDLFVKTGKIGVRKVEKK